MKASQKHSLTELLSFNNTKCLSINSTLAKRRRKYILDTRIHVQAEGEYALKT